MRKKRPKKGTFPFFLAAVVAVLIAAGVYCFWFINKPDGPAVKVYFFNRERLEAVARPLQADETPLQKAVSELLAGPNTEEKLRGLTTQLPEGIKLLGMRVEGGTAVLDFNRKLEEYGGGSTRIEGVIAQIVYTATEVSGIDKVWIWMEGKKDVVLGGEGLILDHPLSRREISY